MKKLFVLSILIFCTLGLSACGNSKYIGMPNPWIECNDNLKQASKVAGFSFPVELSDIEVRAMKDMIEIKYPLDEEREVIIRKASENGRVLNNHGLTDISGDYNNYSEDKDIELFDSVWANIRGNGDKIFVVNFSAESGLYSISCSKGMTLQEVKEIFKIIEQAETTE